MSLSTLDPSFRGSLLRTVPPQSGCPTQVANSCSSVKTLANVDPHDAQWGQVLTLWGCTQPHPPIPPPTHAGSHRSARGSQHCRGRPGSRWEVHSSTTTLVGPVSRGSASGCRKCPGPIRSALTPVFPPGRPLIRVISSFHPDYRPPLSGLGGAASSGPAG